MKNIQRLAEGVRVLLVEDQGLMCDLLSNWLSSRPRFELVAIAKSTEEALAVLETARPDIAIVDFHLPLLDGLSFVQMARQVRPELRSLILTSATDPLTLVRIREASVEGFLDKSAPTDRLGEALEAVADGRRFYSEVFHAILAQEDAKAVGLAKILSRREQQVLAHVLDGKTSREIGEVLGLGVRTVEFHRANLMAKLDAPNLADLIRAVRRRGWSRAVVLKNGS